MNPKTSTERWTLWTPVDVWPVIGPLFLQHKFEKPSWISAGDVWLTHLVPRCTKPLTKLALADEMDGGDLLVLVLSETTNGGKIIHIICGISILYSVLASYPALFPYTVAWWLVGSGMAPLFVVLLTCACLRSRSLLNLTRRKLGLKARLGRFRSWLICVSIRDNIVKLTRQLTPILGLRETCHDRQRNNYQRATHNMDYLSSYRLRV
jgi:hypothetical protein